MKDEYVILVADRNPRIRNFLQRELKAEGHRVYMAESVDQLKQWFHRPTRLDVLVIDPDMPGLGSKIDLADLMAMRPNLAVIFHCLIKDGFSIRAPGRVLAFIEKSGQSVDLLKDQLRTILAETRQA
jgi:DNA-binding NtrC family response regulator